MKYRQYDYDPNPKSDQAVMPHNVDYWKPSWRLENGKIVKDDTKPAIEEKKVEEIAAVSGGDYFQCNACDFKTSHEPSMKAHVTRTHKKEALQ